MAQADITAGRTHDVVLHVNASVAVGLTVLPSTYRVRNAPTFLPRFSTGDPKGIDQGRWKAWVQDDFGGGAGQRYHNEGRANNRFAESNLVDIVEREGLTGFHLAILPQKTSTNTQMTRTLFTNQLPMFVEEVSNRPFLLHYQMSAVFTNIQGDDPFSGFRGAIHNRAQGHWAVHETGLPGIAYSVVRYSGSTIRASGDTILAYDGHASYVPSYNTTAKRLAVYDNKLWRSQGGQVAAYTPVANTLGTWTDFYNPGDQGVPVTNMAEAYGKLYIGKEDSLEVFDAGRIYQIQDFHQYRDPENFNVMIRHRGELYFNIRDILYRITGGGVIERLEIPRFGGVYTDAASVGSDLILALRGAPGGSRYLAFDSDSGAWRQWFDTSDYTTSITDNSNKWLQHENAPTSIKSAFGHLFLGPSYWRDPFGPQNHTLDFPVSMVNKLSPPENLEVPNYYNPSALAARAYLITSIADMGLPDVDKLFGRVKVTLQRSAGDVGIKIKALTKFTGPTLTGGLFRDFSEGTFAEHTAQWRSGVTEQDEAGDSLTDTITSGFDDVLFGCDTPPLGFFVRMKPTPSREKFLPPRYGGTGGLTLFDSAEDGTESLRKTGILTYALDKDDWIKTTWNGKEAYWVEFSYVGLDYPTPITIYEVTPIGNLYTQEWTELYSDSSGTPGVWEQISAPFDLNTIGRHVAIQIELNGQVAGDVTVDKIEVEYLDLQQPLDVIDFTAVATDGIQLLNMELEHSGQFIAASLFSMHKSGLLYTAQLPWPPPAAHTSQFRVSIPDPGALVPILAYDNTFSGAPIPVRLDEMRTEGRAGWGDTAELTGL